MVKQVAALFLFLCLLNPVSANADFLRTGEASVRWTPLWSKLAGGLVSFDRPVDRFQRSTGPIIQIPVQWSYVDRYIERSGNRGSRCVVVPRKNDKFFLGAEFITNIAEEISFACIRR